METQLLTDQNIPPTKEIIENALGESSSTFNELIETVTDVKLGLATEWRYYKDGKAWLCKVCYKKKTIFWLSVWDRFFKISFYFTAKNCHGISELAIDDKIKEEFSRSTAVGKLIPLIIKMYRREQIDDVIKIIQYKKSWMSN